MTTFFPNNSTSSPYNSASFAVQSFYSFKLMKCLIIGMLLLVIGVDMKGAITSVQAGGNWNSTSTWVGAVIPSTNDDVIINGSGGNSVTLQSKITIASLTLNDNGGIIAGNYDITVKGNLKIGNFNSGYGLSRDNGIVTVGGNFDYNNGWSGASQFGGGAQAGYFIMNGTSFTITNNNQPISIPKFRVGNASLTITKNGSTSFSILTEYDRNCLPSPTIVGAFNVSGSTIGITCMPSITVSKTALPGFSYGVGSGPSTEQTYMVSGSNLIGNITITAPSDYEISTLSGSYGTSPLTLTQFGGLVSPTTIYVRLKSGRDLGSYNSQPIVHTTTYATINVICSGTVNCISPPTVTSPVTYCQNTTAADLSATLTGTATSLKWVDFGSGSVGGTNTGTDENYTDNNWSNWALQFITNFDNVTLNSVDVYSSNKNTPSNCTIGIYNNSGILLTSTTLNMPASTLNIKYTITFNYLIVSAGNYRIKLISGSSAGSFGKIILASNTSKNINITGDFINDSNTSTPNNIYNNIQYTYNNQSPTPPTPSTAAAGSTTYYVTQNNGTCTSGTATIEVVVSSTCPKYFRSKTNGDWNTITTWEESKDGVTSWDPATTIPTSADNLVTVQATHTITVSTANATASNLIVNGSITITGTYTLTPNIATINGKILVQNTASLVKGTGVISFNAGSIYQHDQNEGTIPAATWNAASTCYITGITSTDPSGDGQAFGNLTYDCSGMKGNRSMAAYTDGLLIAGDFKVLNTGTGQLRMNQSSLTINGNCIINGNFRIGSDADRTLIVVGNFSLTGGNLDMCDGNSFGTIEDHGNFSMNSGAILTVTSTTGGYGNVNFNGTRTQIFSKTGGTISNTINFNVTNTSILDVNTSVIDGSNGTFTLNSGAGIITAHAQGLSTIAATGSIQVTGIKTYSTGANYTYDGTVAQATGNGLTGANNLTISNPAGVTLSGDATATGTLFINTVPSRLIIPPAICLTANTISNTDPNQITIQASPTGIGANGSLIFHNDQNTSVYGTVELNSLATISGSVALDKYHWQYFGIPVQQVTASPTFDNAYVRQWNEAGTLTSNNYWVPLNNGSSLIPFTGYEICQTSSKIYQIKGKLVNSDFIKYSVASPGIVLPYTTDAAYSGQNIFANPYTAAIDINKLYFGEGTEKTVFLYNTGTKKNWSDNSGGSTDGIKAGQYKSVPQVLATAISDPTIPSMQGFLIKAMANISKAVLPNAYFSITYSSVVTPNTSALRAPASLKNDSSEYVFSKIDVTGTNSYDQLWLFTEPTCTHSFENGWDGRKLMGSTFAPQLFAMEADGMYQVDAVDDMNNTYLGFQPGEDKQYTLTFKNENLGKYYSNVYLLDLVENKTVEITSDSSSYTFTAVPFAPQTKRFKIVTIPVLKDANTVSTDIQVFSSERTIFVNNLSKSNGNLVLYDISGRIVKTMQFGANCITPLQTSFPTGVYIVKATAPTFDFTTRLILQ